MCIAHQRVSFARPCRCYYYYYFCFLCSSVFVISRDAFFTLILCASLLFKRAVKVKTVSRVDCCRGINSIVTRVIAEYADYTARIFCKAMSLYCVKENYKRIETLQVTYFKFWLLTVLDKFCEKCYFPSKVVSETFIVR